MADGSTRPIGEVAKGDKVLARDPRQGSPAVRPWKTRTSTGAPIHIVNVADPELEAIFEEWPSLLIPSGATAAFSLDYRDADLAYSVVRTPANTAEVLVDNNYRVVVSGVDLDIDALRRP